MHPVVGSKLAATLPCRPGLVSPHDVGVNHDAMVTRVCWLMRLNYWYGLLASTFHVVLFLFGYAADVRIAVVKLSVGLLAQVATVYSVITGKPHGFELWSLHVIGSASQCLFALCVLAGSVEWTMHDIVVMVVTRPLISLAIMCVHSVLKVAGHAESDWLMVTTCTAINGAVAWKTVSDMPSLAGVASSAIVAQGFVALVLKCTTDALLKERDVLKLVRDGLQQLLDSQDSLWKSVFDATLICDPAGCIVSASAQAIHLLQLESPNALMGQSFSSLVAPDEKERMNNFLEEVVASPSSQAMTIQSTFARNHDCLVELQINAVRFVQNICGSSAQVAFGILLGARLVEPTRESSTRCQDGQPLQPDAQREVECADMWIAFDAGTSNFRIDDCSPQLCLNDDRKGLMRWFPPMVRQSLEKWVVDEVAACGDSGNVSSDVVEHFHVRVPAVPARSITAERAWLEVKPTEADEDGELSLPAVLWLRGVVSRQWHPIDGTKPAKQQLASILEDGTGSTPSGSILEECELRSVTGSEELTPSDSASQQRVRFRR